MVGEKGKAIHGWPPARSTVGSSAAQPLQLSHNAHHDCARHAAAWR
ncbi:Hypothetical protein CAP_6628 [Chondromyces apiculatus DSM 436]|uniref:Uncharacterized protein n=1 Tax=Chondromyces apiculatus DSM 436 TaxID=1192034 RepID=A0A017T0I6_9BACT|nr:Hypothetical protein CAP_6628 [Chondromyces apiculatus DSM 436]